MTVSDSIRIFTNFFYTYRLLILNALLVTFSSICILALRRKKRPGMKCYKELPKYQFPFSKDYNYKFIRMSVSNRNLPKMFRTLPILNWKLVILTDFDVIKDAFSRVELSSRFVTEKLSKVGRLLRKDWKLQELSARILGARDSLITNGDCGCDGIAAGPYNDFHRAMRKAYHCLTNVSKNGAMHEIIDEHTNQMTDAISKAMSQSKDGFDPILIFQHGTMNIVTQYTLGKKYDLNDPEFQALAKAAQTIIDHVPHRFVGKLLECLIPMRLLEFRCVRKFLKAIIPGDRLFVETLCEELFPRILKEIKYHRETLERNAPRNFIDIMLIESETNTCINYWSMCMTIASLYIAGSDTVTNSLRWLLLILARNPDFQEKSLRDIEENCDASGKVMRHKCNFLNSLLLENMRMFPVSDSLPHFATEDVFIDGFIIPKGCPIIASYTAVMHDPKNFPDPGTFNPERFIVDGKFQHDPKVCAFGIGNRHCVGMRIAREEYFQFTVKLIQTFKIISDIPTSLKPSNVGSLLVPRKLSLRFVPRNP